MGLLLMTPARLSQLPVADIGWCETDCNRKKMNMIVEELRRNGFITLMSGGKEFCLHATGKMAITPQIRRYRPEDEPVGPQIKGPRKGSRRRGA